MTAFNNKTVDMQKFLNDFAKKQFGKTVTECIEEGICVTCHSGIAGFRDTKSQDEYKISGMCQLCQDEIFGD